jgi:DNA repair photolyase
LDGPVRYRLIQARSVLNRVKAMMPLNWTINPYRGCRHACVYCFARPSHTYLGLNAGLDFQSVILVKINAPQVLRAELARPGWKREPICLGSATDPYQPAERRYRLSHQILEALCEMSNPLDIITKSHLVLEDLDLLVELSRRTGGQVAVNMSLTTLNETKAFQIDPGAPAPRKRLEAIARLSAAGIKTRLFIMPILPGITDRPDELEALVQSAAEVGAQSVHADPLRIARGSEEYFYRFLDTHYPELRPRYERLYAQGRRTMAAERYKAAVRDKMAELRARYNLDTRHSEPEAAHEEIQPQAYQPELAIFDEPARLEAALEAAENRASRSVATRKESARRATPAKTPASTPEKQTSFDFGE